jgi:hypothetical protein
VGVGHHDDEITGADPAVRDGQNTQAEHQCGRGRTEDVDKGAEAGLDLGALDTGLEPLGAPRMHPVVLEALGAERLHHLHRRKRLRCQRCDLTLFRPLAARHLSDPLLVVHGRPQQQWGDQEGDERQQRVDPERHREHPDEHE